MKELVTGLVKWHHEVGRKLKHGIITYISSTFFFFFMLDAYLC